MEENRHARFVNPYTDFGFKKVFDQAEIARFTPDESRIYEESLKHYRDMRNVINSAKREGREEGREEGLAQGREEGIAQGRAEGRTEGAEENKRENARRMKADGMAVELIAKYTGLTKESIEDL